METLQIGFAFPAPTHCSKIFKTCIRLLSKNVGKLVAWLPKESVTETMPKIFKTAGHGKLRCIIDCSEVFIERPKKLDAQAATWWDYKSHNTIKFLIGISPTDFVTFLSDTYGGKASDTFICHDRFFDCLDSYDEIMADRGFQITEELMMILYVKGPLHLAKFANIVQVLVQVPVQVLTQYLVQVFHFSGIFI